MVQRRQKLGALIIAAALAIGGLIACPRAVALDKDKPPVNPKPEEKVKPTNPPAETVPVDDDPTKLSPTLKEAVDPAPKIPTEPPPAPVQPFSAPPPPPPLPDVIVKGFVEAEGKPPSALLEVNGKLQRLVSSGAELHTHAAGSPSLTLLVKKVTREDIEIEVVQLKQTIHVK